MPDYLDNDVAYLLGMLVARGEVSSSGNAFRMVVHLPSGLFLAEGETRRFDTEKEINLGLVKIRERLLELLDADIRTVHAAGTVDMVVQSHRRTMAWRNIAALLENQQSFPYFKVPRVLLEPGTPLEVKREFMRGFADVAGNIRLANRDQSGRHRVRLDILNYRTNWDVPVQLCLLLQNHLEVGVPTIAWGHPNLGREWREHQLNIYADDFTPIGFCFDYKMAALEELAALNRQGGGHGTSPCPGQRRLGKRKPKDPQEKNADKLPPVLVGKHFDAYWQICRALGCPRRPPRGAQLQLLEDETSDLQK